MAKRFTRILSAVAILGQLCISSVRRSFAQEAGGFKSSPDQYTAMATGGVFKEQRFSFDQVKATADQLMGANRTDLDAQIEKLSRYQRGQLAIYALYQFYHLPVDARQRSASGKQGYYLLGQLYYDEKDPKFRQGFADPEMQDQLKKDPSFSGFFTAIVSRYGHYLEREQADGNRSPLRLIDFLLAGYDQKEPPSVIVPRKIDWMASANTTLLDAFIRTLNVQGITPGAPNKQKITELTQAFQKTFGLKEEEQARQALRATLDAYSMLSADDRKLFGVWFREEGKAKTPMPVATMFAARSTEAMPYQVVYSAFTAWKTRQEEQRFQQAQEEAELKKYPQRIRESNLQEMAAAFERTPSGERLEDIGARLEYVQKFQQILRNKGQESSKQYLALGSEVQALQTWLDQTLALDPDTLDRNLTRLGVDIVPLKTRMERQLATLRAGMAVVQIEYYSASARDLRLTDTLQQAASAGIYRIYSRYLLALDARTARLFQQIPPSSPDLPVEVGKRISEELSTDRLNQAQGTWTTDYYPNGMIPPQEVSRQVTRAQAMVSVAELKPLVAYEFAQYVEAVRRSGVTSPEEKKLMVEAVAQLNFIEKNAGPLLAAKFLRTMAHLADVCAANPEAYAIALHSIISHIDYFTGSLYEPTSPTRLLPVLPLREKIAALDNAFEQLAQIDRTTLARETRYHLLDRTLQISPDIPFAITQRTPPWMYPLTPPLTTGIGATVPYPFPSLLNVTPTLSLLGSGAVANSTFGGTVNLWRPIASQLSGQTSLVNASTQAYLFPQHPGLSQSDFLPGVYINNLSSTQLLNAIDQAFLPSKEPEYSAETVGGAGGGAVTGARRTESESWKVTGLGALGTWITPTGGAALGGTKTEQSTFAGFVMEAVPLGRIADGPVGKTRGLPILDPLAKDDKKVYLDTALGGYEKLDDGTKRWLAQAIATRWDRKDPKKSSQLLLAVNGEEEKDGKAWTRARYFFVDREGTIYDLKGGVSDFIEMHNFLAAYGDRNFNSPATHAWNIEPGIERGGGVLAIDIDKQIPGLGIPAMLVHAQAVPFLTSVPAAGQPAQAQPLLLEWTLAGATTREKTEQGETTVYELSLPGAIFRSSQPGDLRQGQATSAERIVRQDVNFTTRTWKGQNVWELSMGAGGGRMEKTSLQPGDQGVLLQSERNLFRGGAMLKFQWAHPEISEGAYSSFGVGYYGESGPTDLQALGALQTLGNMQQAEQLRSYVEGLERHGVTLYGSGPISRKLVVGGLAHVLAQITIRKEGDTEKREYDQTFWKAIGFLRGLKSISRFQEIPITAKAEVVRISQVDEIVTEYNSLVARVGEDPRNAQAAIQEFQNRFASRIDDIFDHYYLGVEVSKNFSMEVTLVAKENNNQWSQQIPQTVFARMLGTWGENFVRLYASLPVYAPLGFASSQSVGIAGAGTGFDVLNRFWLQRMAFDVGVLLALQELPQETTGMPMSEQQVMQQAQKWERSGVFAEGAVQLYASISRYSVPYRRLERTYQQYVESLTHDNFGAIPADVRRAMLQPFQVRTSGREEMGAEGVAYGVISDILLDKIAKGATVTTLSPQQKEALANGLYLWFYSQKIGIETEFNRRFQQRLVVAGSVYALRESDLPREASPLATPTGGTTGGTMPMEGTMAMGAPAAAAGSSGTPAALFDIGAFYECASRLKSYAILARRQLEEQKGTDQKAWTKKLFAVGGVDLEVAPHVVVGGSGAVTLTGQREAGGALSVRWRFLKGDVPMELAGVLFGRSLNPPVYLPPPYAPVSLMGQGEFGALIMYTIGAGQGVQPYPLQTQPALPGSMLVPPGATGR